MNSTIRWRKANGEVIGFVVCVFLLVVGGNVFAVYIELLSGHRGGGVARNIEESVVGEIHNRWFVCGGLKTHGQCAVVSQTVGDKGGQCARKAIFTVW